MPFVLLPVPVATILRLKAGSKVSELIQGKRRRLVAELAFGYKIQRFLLEWSVCLTWKKILTSHRRLIFVVHRRHTFNPLLGVSPNPFIVLHITQGVRLYIQDP